MPNRGGAQLRAVSRDLAVAGSPRGMRLKLRRNIAAAMKPLQAEVKSNALAIPTSGRGSTGLRSQLARATKIRISLGARVSRVRVITDGKLMPAGKSSLPKAMEGVGRGWRHPVYGGDHWVPQDSHPYMAPAIPKHLPTISASVDAAVRETAAELSRGT